MGASKKIASSLHKVKDEAKREAIEELKKGGV